MGTWTTETYHNSLYRLSKRLVIQRTSQLLCINKISKWYDYSEDLDVHGMIIIYKS